MNDKIESTGRWGHDRLRGATFIASLIKDTLIDEFHLFINPAAIRDGVSIFRNIIEIQKIKFNKSIPFDRGIVLLHYDHQ
jgi:riboflavin biosynthesis pyrimidine reductase